MTEKNKNILTSFFKKEYNKMISYVNRYFNADEYEDSQDIIQDVMLNVFNIADFTIPIQNLSAYIYRSLKNRIIDNYRKKKETLSLNDPKFNKTEKTLEDLIHDTRYDIAGSAEKEEIREILFNAIDELDQKYKSIIIMTEFEGKSFKEIANHYKIPIGTLLARKKRALEKIRKYLIDNWQSEGIFSKNIFE